MVLFIFINEIESTDLPPVQWLLAIYTPKEESSRVQSVRK